MWPIGNGSWSPSKCLAARRQSLSILRTWRSPDEAIHPARRHRPVADCTPAAGSIHRRLADHAEWHAGPALAECSRRRTGGGSRGDGLARAVAVTTQREALARERLRRTTRGEALWHRVATRGLGR